MIEIVFIGSGAVAAEVTSYIADINNKSLQPLYLIKGYLDDSEENFNKNASKYNFIAPYLGKIIDFDFKTELHYVFGFASSSSKKMLVEKLANLNLEFPNIIHPSAIIDASAKLGRGNVLYPFIVIGPGTNIGDFNLITTYSFVSHDCIIGSYNFLSTAGMAGNVNVGNDNFFGIRSTIIPNIEIGNGNTIQAGMTISNNVKDNETIFHRFKEKIVAYKS